MPRQYHSLPKGASAMITAQTTHRWQVRQNAWKKTSTALDHNKQILDGVDAGKILDTL